MNISTSSTVWTALGWTFLHVGWIGVVVGLAASLARRSLRRASAEVRHAAAFVALLTLAASPFVAFAAVYEPAPTSIPPPSVSTARVAATPEIDAAAAIERVPILPTPPSQPATASRWFEPWIDVLPGVWLAGSLLILARTAVGLAGVERLRRAAVPLRDGPVAERCRELAKSLGVVREVGLAVCDRIAGPLLIGVIRPTILLPAAALSGWAPDQLEMALLHELAHLRRRDNLICLLQQLVEALLFFHPTTWWLSAWLRLERETCCDLRVVARTGRPRAYAELLATLAGAGSSTPPCPAMTERPIATRIRRILFKEDRPMPLKPTVPETLALAAATLIAAALTLPTRAEAPRPKSETAADLKRIAAAVIALPVTPDIDPDGRPDPRIMALLEIADKQNAQSDHAGALETVKHLKVDPPNEQDLWRDRGAQMRCGVIMKVAAVRYDAGEVASARGEFQRLIELVCRPNPDLDAAALRAAGRRLMSDLRLAGNPDGSVVVDVVANSSAPAASRATPNVEARVDDEIAIGRFELLAEILDELAKRRETELEEPISSYFSRLKDHSTDPLITVAVECALVAIQLKAGDKRNGMEHVATVQRMLSTLPADAARDFFTVAIIHEIVDIDIDHALGLISKLPSAQRNTVLRRILERDALCTISDRPWDDGEEIKITIGDPALTPKESARALLPRFIALAKTIEDDAERARTLAVLAHLQARGDDPAGAMATAETIPDLHRPEGPVDGFYDSVKPAVFALIGLRRAEAGDQAGADAAFARSRELTRALTSEPERVIAWITLAEKLEATGRRDQANAVLADAIPLAKSQPEPRRSRMLGMLSRTQLKTAGVDAATATIDAIRDEPGLEKGYALYSVADALHDKGDDEAAHQIARQALACLEPKPSDPRPVPNDHTAVTRISFIDYDAETPAAWLAMHRGNPQAALRKLAGNPTPPPAGTPWRQRMQQSMDVAEAFRRGGLDEALKTVESLDSPASRASALHALDFQVANDETVKR